MKSSPKTLVTGARRGLGRLVADLVPGAIAIDEPVSLTKTEPAGLDFTGSLTDRAFIKGVLSEGVRNIVHPLVAYAARAPVDTPYETRYEDLSPPLVALFETAAECGVDRFVLISDARLLGAGEGDLDEATPLEPAGPYLEALYDAELELLRTVGRRRSLGEPTPRLLILRAAPWYGLQGRVPVWLAPGFLDADGTVLPEWTGGPSWHLVHARDVAAAALHLAELDAAVLDSVDAGPRLDFIVADDEPTSLAEILKHLQTLAGAKLGAARALPERYEGWTQWLASRPGRQLIRAAAGRVLPRGTGLDRFDPQLLLLSRHFDTTRLRATGFEPVYPSWRAGLTEEVENSKRPQEESGWRTSFAETMQGYFESAEGRREVVFRVECAYEGVQMPLRDSLWRLDGDITVEGLAREVPTAGSLEISLFKKGHLRYDLRFDAGDMGYQLIGVKTINWRHPLDSFTQMEVELRRTDSGERLHTGHMWFDFGRDIVDFMGTIAVRRA